MTSDETPVMIILFWILAATVVLIVTLMVFIMLDPPMWAWLRAWWRRRPRWSDFRNY